MDLNKVNAKNEKAANGVKMTLEHPSTGDPLLDEKTKEPLTITLLGQDSDEYKKNQFKVQDKRLQKRVKGNKIAITMSEIDRDAIEVLVSCTKGWTHIQLGDQPLPYSTENARRLYTEVPFVREQAEAFIADRANFLGN